MKIVVVTAPCAAGQRIDRFQRRSLVATLLGLLMLAPMAAVGEDVTNLLDEANALQQQNQFYAALNRLQAGAQVAPDDYRIEKARGDLLMTLRRNGEALHAYRLAAQLVPDAIEVHWASWALLDRMGAQDQAIRSMKEIIRLDPDNPLAHLRLAKALSQADRLEEAVVSYRRAVELAPDQLVYRLLYARALFDTLDYAEAQRETELVLAKAEKETREWASARDLLAFVRGEAGLDKGRRFDQSQTLRKLPWYSYQNLKEWVLARGRAWQLMEQGRYAEAEAVLRKALTFNPEDHRAFYDLGLTLMELGRYDMAIEAFEKGIRLTKFAEFYPDSVFQIGRCFAKMGRWEDALARFERVLEIRDWRKEDFYALNFPDLAKVQEALDDARQHTQASKSDVGVGKGPQPERLGPEPYEYLIPPMANGQSLFELVPSTTQVASITTDTVSGSFRQMVTARRVVQDDLQTGLHEFMPLDPTDTFPLLQAKIYLVFTLTSTQEDEVDLTSRWVAEQVVGLLPNTVVGTDRVLLGLNERSGYFWLGRPEGGWQPGIYRVDLYLGPQDSAYTHVADIRFRIVPQSRMPTTKP